ncbi:hypothetical protein [Clostridium butyricum]|uniref:hypothetical protein n=1 Tax=Clostridium butyricum TaxID=1492 RepID=UPI00374E4D1D
MLFIICGLIVPIIFIIYNIICYLKRKVIYTINDSSLVIVDDRFFKLQLSLSLLNSLLVSVVVYIWEKQNLKFGILLFIMVYWGINYLIKYIGILKKYVQMKK